MKVQSSRKAGDFVGISGCSNLLSFDRPIFADSLKFPNNITELTSQNVSELIGKFTKMLCFVQEQFSRLSVKVLYLEDKISRCESAIIRETPSMVQLERWRRDQKMNTDLRVLSHRIALTEARGEKELAWSFLQNYERCIAALSRELTRKTSELRGQF